MAAQEHVALARSLFDLYNSRQSDPAWLDKSRAAFAADCEVIDVPSGATLRGPDGYKRFLLFFAERFPDSRTELTNVFATEDQVVLEGTWHWNDTGPLYLPSGALPSMRRSGETRWGTPAACFLLAGRVLCLSRQMGWDPFSGSRRASHGGKRVPVKCTVNGARG